MSKKKLFGKASLVALSALALIFSVFGLSRFAVARADSEGAVTNESRVENNEEMDHNSSDQSEKEDVEDRSSESVNHEENDEGSASHESMESVEMMEDVD